MPPHILVVFNQLYEELEPRWGPQGIGGRSKSESASVLQQGRENPSIHVQFGTGEFQLTEGLIQPCRFKECSSIPSS
jgi:hypothetical protein